MAKLFPIFKEERIGVQEMGEVTVKKQCLRPGMLTRLQSNEAARGNGLTITKERKYRDLLDPGPWL